MLKKIVFFIVFVFSSILIAGLFGIIHDQITYSICPEYYTCFKFHQFRIGYYLIENNINTAVSLVGFFATWWTGLIIGVIIGILGILKPDYSKLIRIKYKSLFYVFLTTVLFSIIGYFIGVAKTKGIEDWPIHYLNDGSDMSIDYQIEKAKDIANFIKVGTIHNYSYLGGLVGLVLGIIFHKRKQKTKN